MLSVSVLLLAVSPSAMRAQAIPAQAPSVEANRKALNAIFADYWEDKLKHDPEFASTLGDKRYNDQISDYSVKAVNEALAREQNFLMRLAAIDSAGLTDAGEDQPRFAAARLGRGPGSRRLQGVGDAA